MSNKFRVLDYDIIYLSYDEPNADKNYADLCSKIPWAKRVHGVEGSDAAHKACARLSETDRFITIDGDNIINKAFLAKEFDLDDHEDVSWNKEVKLDDCVISWTARNTINGLMYGNGGIKCWPKTKVLNMRTHENADPGNPHAQVDFCWDMEYIQMNTCYSEIMNNATPQQAWRAGFREGVKMALDRGIKPSVDQFKRNHWKNLHRLYIWLMVGADVENGDWAILGARAGLYMTMCTDWDYVQVRDFNYLNDLWKTSFAAIEDIEYEIGTYGIKLINELGLPIAESALGAQQSKFFKTVYQNPARIAKQQFIKET
tara:strand:- start:3739 stop:4683 length:945 start_codon:yes stop_codon:yes gene_type:complete